MIGVTPGAEAAAARAGGIGANDEAKPGTDPSRDAGCEEGAGAEPGSRTENTAEGPSVSACRRFRGRPMGFWAE